MEKNQSNPFKALELALDIYAEAWGRELNQETIASRIFRDKAKKDK